MSSISGSPTSPTAARNSAATSWQDRLQDHCHHTSLPPPTYAIVSDRRGGRTAWSSTVTISGRSISARFWYDGQYVHNAREDAAEVALLQLTGHGSYTANGGGSGGGGGAGRI